MHLLPVTTVLIDEFEQAVDLGQPQADVLVLSFGDGDLIGLSAAQASEGSRLPSLGLASLRQLRHPLSVDLYVEKTVRAARFVLVRCLGGPDYWRYGLERLAAACAQSGARLAVLPGDDRPDPRLIACSTVSAKLCRELDAYFRAGGVDNLRMLLRRIAREIGREVAVEPPRPLPPAFAWSARRGVLDLDAACAALPGGRPAILFLVYRSAVLAGDTLAAAAFCGALEARGAAVLTLAVASLQDEPAADLLAEALRRVRPAAVVTTTAFSARDDRDFVLDLADCPVFQGTIAGSTLAAWQASSRGLSAADLSMQVVLPEFDGRIGLPPLSFKDCGADPGLGGRRQKPHPAGIAQAADQVLAWTRLAQRPRRERRLALVLSDYPARGGRAGFAVGLDTPASVARILDLLAREGYDAERAFGEAELMPALTDGPAEFAVSLPRYAAWLATLPSARRHEIEAEWGQADADPVLVDGAFRFRAVRAGKALVALQPDRGRSADRKGGYHDPNAPPSHAYAAFYLAMREIEPVDALIHLGTHGTTEWLPGKAVALSAACWPRLVAGALPVVYPFIVDDPGEAAPAKRRLPAVTIGHLTPAVAAAGLSDGMAVLRELVEEYASAQVLDPRRARLVAAEIRERARESGLAALCGVTENTAMEQALSALDAHLCDLAQVSLRDGLHVFGEAPAGFEACADGERAGLLAALDGRFVAPGPAGSPSRGRTDVLPTGRNLSTMDPRAVPTRAAAALGGRAAAEVVRRHLQEHGDYPRRIVMDLWASPTLRSGGEDIAHALALMGVGPAWDRATTRVTGFEIVPQPLLDHPRVDVTIRISGTFRDVFPDQIALLDRAARAVALLEEDDAWNEPAAARRRGASPARIFGAAPGRYGAAAASLALDGQWSGRADLGAAYLATTSHAFGSGGNGVRDLGFAARVREADAFVHITDVPERDILDGDSAGDAIGGFAAAAASLRSAPALYSLDASRPDAPKARSVDEDIGRLVRGRLAHPRWIEAQLRHGWRGAAELAQAVDALFVFAATTQAVPAEALDAVFAAYVADAATFERISSANPAAARAIADRLADARRRGLWASRRNSVDAQLALVGEAAP